MRKKLSALLVISLMLLTGCQPGIPKSALQLQPESLATRQAQTRRFETANYETMLGSAAAVLQDLGFTLEEAEFDLGVLVGSKQRDATSGGQIAGAIFLAALTGAVMYVDSDQEIRVSMVMRQLESPNYKKAKTQKITPQVLQRVRADVTTAVAGGLRAHFPNEVSQHIARQIGLNTAETLTNDLAKLMRNMDGGECTVRVTFQRIIYNTAGQITLTEQLNDPELYQQFFDRLSQALFLEAHEI